MRICIATIRRSTAAGYGIFNDELYYLACGRHLDWGYVDYPPLVALIAATAHFVVGDGRARRH